MALSFHTTAAPVFGRLLPAADMSFLHDADTEVTDALLSFVYDPPDPATAALEDLLDLPDDAASVLGAGPIEDHAAEAEQRCDKKLRACTDDERYGLAALDQQEPALPELRTESVLPPQPLAFVPGADATKASGKGRHQSVQSAVARVRQKRIRARTAELSRLIPGGRKLNTAKMLEEAARHVKLLQAQVGVLALMHIQKEKTPISVQERMHALLVCGGVQEHLAAAGKCLVPMKLIDAVAKDKAVKSNALLNRDLGRFMASLEQ